MFAYSTGSAKKVKRIHRLLLGLLDWRYEALRQFFGRGVDLEHARFGATPAAFRFRLFGHG